VEVGQFDNVQSNPSLSHFIRDDLLEPDGSQMTLEVYRNDIAIRSSALKSSSGEKTRIPKYSEWEGSTESYEEAKAAGFPDHMLRGQWTRYREKGPRSGTRQAIKEFTKVSRDQLKFTLRNAIGDWFSF
jgi:hypothetical protein